MIQAGKLFPEKLIGKTISLEQSLDELVNMDSFSGTGRDGHRPVLINYRPIRSFSSLRQIRISL
jgi:hypothetical protein